LKAALGQHEKGVAEGETGGAAEDGVLQDMGGPGVVRRGGGEGEGEEVFAVAVIDMENFGPGGPVARPDARGVQFREADGIKDDEAPGPPAFF